MWAFLRMFRTGDFHQTSRWKWCSLCMKIWCICSFCRPLCCGKRCMWSIFTLNQRQIPGFPANLSLVSGTHTHCYLYALMTSATALVTHIISVLSHLSSLSKEREGNKCKVCCEIFITAKKSLSYCVAVCITASKISAFSCSLRAIFASTGVTNRDWRSKWSNASSRHT